MLQGLGNVSANNEQLLQHVSFYGAGLVRECYQREQETEREVEKEEEEHVIENDGELQRHGLRYKACHCLRDSVWPAQ